MKKQSVIKLVKVFGVVILLGVGAYFGIDTKPFISYLNAVPEESQVEAPVVPVEPSLVDAGVR